MKLKKYLRKHRMTMVELAEKTGVDVATIHRACHGTVIPSRRTIEAIVRETHGAVQPGDLIQVVSDLPCKWPFHVFPSSIY